MSGHKLTATKNYNWGALLTESNMPTTETEVSEFLEPLLLLTSIWKCHQNNYLRNKGLAGYECMHIDCTHVLCYGEILITTFSETAPWEFSISCPKKGIKMTISFYLAELFSMTRFWNFWFPYLGTSFLWLEKTERRVYRSARKQNEKNKKKNQKPRLSVSQVFLHLLDNK